MRDSQPASPDTDQTRRCRRKPVGGIVQGRLLPCVMVCLLATIAIKSACLVRVAMAGAPSTTSGEAASTAPGHSAGGQEAAPPAAAQPGTAPPTLQRVRSVPWQRKVPNVHVCKQDPLEEAGERKTLLDLRKRDEALKVRAAALARQAVLLAAAKSRLQKDIAALKPMAEALEAAKRQRTKASDSRWQALAQTYAAMAPRDAARIFDGLAPDVTIGLLRRIGSRKAAAILAQMDPQKARQMTERLAGIQLASDAVPGSPSTGSLSPPNGLPDGAP